MQFQPQYFPPPQLDHRSAVFARDGCLCAYCGKKTNVATATIDHVQPLSLGGTNRPDNLVVACRACNNRKGSLSLTAFLLGDPFPEPEPINLVKPKQPRRIKLRSKRDMELDAILLRCSKGWKREKLRPQVSVGYLMKLEDHPTFATLRSGSQLTPDSQVG